MINFDANGNIFPYEIIEVSTKDILDQFIFNSHRWRIYSEYLIFLRTLEEMGIGSCFQFIDGSFTTTKEYPKDIDVVTFVEASFFNQNAVKLLDLRDQFSQIDCFFVPLYQPEERNYFVTQFGLFEWEQLFNTDREYKPKGILKVTFNEWK
jgi:hypothetical protein